MVFHHFFTTINAMTPNVIITIIIMIIFSLGLVFSQNHGSKLMIVQSYTTSSVNKFQHLAFDSRTNNLYIGAVNELIQLSGSLEEKVKVATGPADDSPNCYAGFCSRNTSKYPTDNHNKAILVDQNREQLVFCGSLFQGSCSMRNLRNVTELSSQNCSTIDCFVPVVANDQHSSTVAFIAPGSSKRSLNEQDNQVLYVGVTYSGAGPWRREIPAVSSRSLHPGDAFRIIERNGAKIKLISTEMERYSINYVHGFSSQGFSYFLTTQRKSNSTTSPYVSKLVRICQNDPRYNSYTEIPIECIGEDSTSYNLVQAAFLAKPGRLLANQLGITTSDDVLFAAFAKGENNYTSRPAKDSAFCVFSMKYIRLKFKENIQNCFDGRGKRGLEYFCPEFPCRKTKIQVSEDFCGLEVNSPFGGEDPASQVAVTTHPEILTAVAAIPSDNSTLFFLGTSDGKLKKYGFEEKVRKLDEIVVDKSAAPILQDLIFDSGHNYLFAMTENKLSKIRISDCGFLSSCQDCVNDPYCGWCSSEGRCTTKSECSIPFNWVCGNVQQCPAIVQVFHQTIAREDPHNYIMLELKNVPTMNEHLKCAFSMDGKNIFTNAEQQENWIFCEKPGELLWLSTNSTKQHLDVELSIKRQDFHLITTNVTFFDCKVLNSCSECTSSPFPCAWRVNENNCSWWNENYKDHYNIHSFTLRDYDGLRKEPDYCPRVRSPKGQTRELFVHAGITTNLQLKVENIADYLAPNTTLSCQFNTSDYDVKTTVPATYLQDHIECQIGNLSLINNEKPTANMNIKILWDQTKLLENPDNVSITIYNCSMLAANCENCATLNPEYGCGWCQSTQKCVMQNQCKTTSSTNSIIPNWLHNNQVCPIEIYSFIPEIAPINGITNVTIEGRNLQNIATVKIADIFCNFSKKSQNSTRLVCQIQSSGVKKEIQSLIEVHSNRTTGKSEKHFKFVHPVVKDINPLKGFKSGGTLVTVTGKYLDAGNLAQVWIGHPIYPCNITFRNSTHLNCITSATNENFNGTFNISFDNAIHIYDKGLFSYVDDPVVLKMECAIGNDPNAPQGLILSGGNRLKITGKHFENMEDPVLFTRIGSHNYQGSCSIIEDNLIECTTPQIPEEILTNSSWISESFLSASGIPVVKTFGQFMFNLVPDPEIESFKDFKAISGEYLTIKGHGFDRICQVSDINVIVGNYQCQVVTAKKTELVCQLPPTLFENPDEKDSFNVMAVKVSIGSYFHKDAGYVTYLKPVQETSLESFLNQNKVTVAILGGIILAILVIFVVAQCIFKKSKRKDYSTLKKTEESKRIKFHNSKEDPEYSSLDFSQVRKNSFSVTILLNKSEFPRNNLQILDKQLGSGHWGTVQLGKARISDDKEIDVAVKTPKHESYIPLLESELQILANLPPHQNIVQLIGSCTTNLIGEKFHLILEFCPLGSLKEFLQENEKSFVSELQPDGRTIPCFLATYEIHQDPFSSDSGYEIPINLKALSLTRSCYNPNEKHFCSRDLILWARQVASGMEYLNLNKILHGDLAARNILLSMDRQAKIADFGLSRDLYLSGNYVKKTMIEVPFKIMAPESLEKGIFTTQSDVWSYGILLWEMFSLGKDPYPGYSPGENFLKDLKDGNRLPKPNHATDRIYDLMNLCWKLEPEERMSFTEIKEVIGF